MACPGVRGPSSFAPNDDNTGDAIREIALAPGLVDIKVCAVDEVWSGLAPVWRKERRAKMQPALPAEEVHS